jgi:hypothetical protein
VTEIGEVPLSQNARASLSDRRTLTTCTSHCLHLSHYLRLSQAAKRDKALSFLRGSAGEYAFSLWDAEQNGAHVYYFAADSGVVREYWARTIRAACSGPEGDARETRAATSIKEGWLAKTSESNEVLSCSKYCDISYAA